MREKVVNQAKAVGKIARTVERMLVVREELSLSQGSIQEGAMQGSRKARHILRKAVGQL